MDTPPFKQAQQSLDRLIKLGHQLDKADLERDLIRIITELTEDICNGVNSIKRENEKLRDTVISLEPKLKKAARLKSKKNRDRDWFKY